MELCEECQTDKEEAEQKSPADLNSGISDLTKENTVIKESNSQDEIFRTEDVGEVSQQRSDDIIERLSAKLNSSIDTTTEKFQINPSLVVSTEKLNNLLHKLESDKVYDLKGDDSLEDLDENDRVMSPVPRTPSRESLEKPRLRKCSSLKTSKTPPTTPGRRKIVRWVFSNIKQMFSNPQHLDLPIFSVWICQKSRHSLTRSPGFPRLPTPTWTSASQMWRSAPPSSPAPSSPPRLLHLHRPRQLPWSRCSTSPAAPPPSSRT